MDFDDLIKIAIVLATIVWPLIQKVIEARQKRQESAPPPKPQPRPTVQPRPTTVQPQPPVRRASPAEGMRERLGQALEAIATDAKALGEQVRHDRPNQRFVEVLTEWIPKAAASARLELSRSTGAIPRELARVPQMLLLVFREVQLLIEQRRKPALLPLLGDADALAEACYAPVVQFAKREGLALSTARPVVQLGDVDLAIWTGFAPTSLAPLFLPQAFFEDVRWWPALAHEIGHDFLLSVDGLADDLREELGLPREEIGTLPLSVDGGAIDPSELVRLHGGWFEELFCDVFGTLMCGPGYLASMIELFASPDAPARVLAVAIDPETGRYGVHPPRHLRVHLSAWLLDRAGFHGDAKRLLARWTERHGFPADEELPLLIPTGGRLLRLPFVAFREITIEIVERLYAGPNEALSSHGLQDISGLDYGPHAHQEAERAKASLLAGQVPTVRDVRAVISGAVLAATERPESNARILALARAAIPAVGTGEVRPDAFNAPRTVAPKAAGAGVLDFGVEPLQQAFLLQEILERPRALRR